MLKPEDGLRKHSLTKSSPLCCTTAKTPDEKAFELGNLLLRRSAIIRCQRKFNKPPPGQQRLAKFPKKVVLVSGSDAKTFSPEDFYAWRYEPPISALAYLLFALAAIGVVLVCLFPVAPYWIKASVVYVLSVILIFMLGFLLLRAVIAAVSWIGTGRTVWVLPNVLSDEKPLNQLFSPWIEVEEPEMGTGQQGWLRHVAMRVCAAVVLGGITWILYTKGPNTGKLKSNVGRYRDELFDILNVHNDAKLLSKGSGDAKAKPTTGAPVPPPSPPPQETAPDVDNDDDIDDSADAAQHEEL